MVSVGFLESRQHYRVRERMAGKGVLIPPGGHTASLGTERDHGWYVVIRLSFSYYNFLWGLVGLMWFLKTKTEGRGKMSMWLPISDP